MESTLSKSVAVGALGTTIERLAERGLVDVDMRGPRPVRGGRRTKVYSISPEGCQAVVEEHSRMQRLWSGVKLPNVQPQPQAARPALPPMGHVPLPTVTEQPQRLPQARPSLRARPFVS